MTFSPKILYSLVFSSIYQLYGFHKELRVFFYRFKVCHYHFRVKCLKFIIPFYYSFLKVCLTVEVFILEKYKLKLNFSLINRLNNYRRSICLMMNSQNRNRGFFLLTFVIWTHLNLLNRTIIQIILYIILKTLLDRALYYIFSTFLNFIFQKPDGLDIPLQNSMLLFLLFHFLRIDPNRFFNLLVSYLWLSLTFLQILGLHFIQNS